MLFLELAHVDGDDAALVAKERIGQGKTCLCLADAGRAHKQKDAQGLVRGAQACLAGLDALHNALQGHVLPADSGGEDGEEVADAPCLVAGHLAHRNAGPVGHNLGYGIGSDFDADQRIVALCLCKLCAGLFQGLFCLLYAVRI